MTGSVNAEDVEPLKKAITYPDINSLRHDLEALKNLPDYEPLMSGAGLAGLPNWATEHFSVVGNLVERNFDEHDVAMHLKKLLDVAPSLKAVCHVGAAYEGSECVATVRVVDGDVVVDSPDVTHVPDIPESQLQNAMMAAMFAPRR